MKIKNFLSFFSEEKMMIIIIIFSILARLLYLNVPFIINIADASGYVEMADAVWNGLPKVFFDDYIYRTPVYPLFIFLTKVFFGKTSFAWGLSLVQHLLGVIMAVLIFKIGQKVFNKWVGFFAGIVTGFNAFQVYYEHNAMSDFFFTFLTVFAFYIFLKALLENKKKFFLFFGILYGLNLLTRPLLQAFFLVFPFIIYLFNQNVKTTLKSCSYILIPALILITPWFLQNIIRHHYFGFVPFTGVQLMVRTQNYMEMQSRVRIEEKKVYRRAMKEVNGCTDEVIDQGECGQAAVGGWARLQKYLGYNAIEANKALEEIAFEAIMKNKGRYLKETVNQTGYFLSQNSREYLAGDPDIDLKFREDYYKKLIAGNGWAIFQQKMIWQLTPKILYFSFGGGLGIILALLKKNKKAVVFILLVVYMVVLTMAIEEWTVLRYRLPLEPFLFLFTGVAIYSLIQFIKRIDKKFEEGVVIERVK
ncbi:MAG: glycosyltransferase family 39 protein [Patescibacteria group bacterium]|nr:glycosyltransferase family 39 protein [Patescibacteria group bacterium]